jgi:homocysteine S-methyltransferase
MNRWQQVLDNFGTVVLDGALGTELEKLGCDLADALWSAKVLVEQPEKIQAVHRAYFEAGADVATTASYQATVPGFAKRGLSPADAEALIRKSVELAVEVRDQFWAGLDAGAKAGRPMPLVAGSVGPYGAYLADGSEYRGDYTVSEDELVEFHRPRIRALLEAGADVLACETVPNLLEAKALAGVLAEFPQAGAWLSFSARDGAHISSGEAIADCAAWADSQPQIVAIGVNCTAPQHVDALVQAIRANTSKAILVYPNAGATYDAVSKTWSTEASHSDFGCSAQLWHASGASILGGCCQTSPADIASIAELLRK